MPFAFLLIGTVLVVSALQGTEKDLGALLKGDLTGKDSFVWWAFAIMGVGLVGYVKPLKGFADTFLTLILIALFLHNSGAFENAVSEIGTGTQTPPVLQTDNLSPDAGSSGGATATASSSPTVTGVVKSAAAAGKQSGKTAGSTLEGVASGAASGAAMGAVAGPWGAAAGAVIGGIMGGIG